jgi:sec-independent protein translocase protein TatA
MGNLTGWHLLIVLLVILLLFGASRLPQLARSIGQSTKVLRQELRDDDKTTGGDTPSSQTGADSTPAGTTAESRPADPPPSDPQK